MRFVIVGAGRVGSRTARVLCEEGHEAAVIDRDATKLDRLEGIERIEVIEGDGGNEAVLARADLERAEGLAALTGDLNTNFTACLIADHYGCRTVMRIDEDYREDIYRKYAAEVDEVIYPERLGAILTKNALLGGSSRAIADVAQHIQIVEFTVTEASPMRGYTLSELELPSDSEVLAFGKKGEPLELPQPDVSLELGDRLVVIADFDRLADVRRIIVGEVGRATAGGS